MIIPGLDRIDGTAVSPELLNSDELWHEHTSEILELLQQENEGKQPDDCVSMVSFCRDFALGVRTTMAMRRAMTRKEWQIDELAVWLENEDNKSQIIPPVKVEEPQQRRRNRNKAVSNASTITMTLKRKAAVPGIIFAVGAGYVFQEQNSAIRKALKRVKDITASDGLYFTPENAFHITVATLQKYVDRIDVPNSGTLPPLDIDALELKIRASQRIKDELSKGPITLIADHLEIPSGNAIVLIFKDKENRMLDLRKAIKETLGDHIESLHIPDIIHSTIARVTSVPSCSKSVMMQKLQGIVENIRIEVTTADVVVEARKPYFNVFPEGAYIHWDLVAPKDLTSSSTSDRGSEPMSVAREETSIDKEHRYRSWMRLVEKDESVLVALFAIAASFVMVWLVK